MDNKNEILIYEDKDGKTCVDVKFIDQDVWLTKYQLANILQYSFNYKFYLLCSRQFWPVLHNFQAKRRYL